MDGCLVVECTTKVLARGYCRLHYERWMRCGSTNDPRPEITERVCSDCHTLKPSTEYHKKNISPKGKQTYQSYCKDCDHARRYARALRDPSYGEKSLTSSRKYNASHKAERSQAQREKRALDPNLNKLTEYKRHLKKRYKISWEVYLLLVEKQNNCCAICGIEFEDILTCKKKPHVDHDHITGKVRGVLCGSCNTGIGHLRDSLEVVEAAAAYLKKHQDLTPQQS